VSCLINNISVIIPVFNAERFLQKAVASALVLPEVKEVLLIEDGSSDNSFEVCKALETGNDKIRLFAHPNHENKGAGASRNVGIENATGDFIAFLDADDFYLPNRFEAERNIFETQPDVDGVYGALGFHYYSEEGKEKYDKASFGKLTTLNGKPSFNELFLSLTWLHPKINGHFSIVALTLKRKIFDDKAERFGLLKMHEDTVFIIQLSLSCRLEAGIIDRPVALRGVHHDNRIVNNKEIRSKLFMWIELYNWAKMARKSNRVIKQFAAFKDAEQLRFISGIPAFSLWLKASACNQYFLKDSVLFTVSTKKVYGKKIAKIICFVKDRMQFHILKYK
jgi:glycosyltransferase involved in cell wall biosynthesis